MNLNQSVVFARLLVHQYQVRRVLATIAMDLKKQASL